MPDKDSLQDFLRDAIHEHDAGASLSEAPTMLAAAAIKRSEMGALPGHEVQGFIARGGMGAIYLARQQALEREVAVKVMTRDAGSAEMAERFRREALVLGRLAHPNIVPVYDIGTDDEGQLFYTMKLVKGRTLQHILNDLRTEDAAALKEHTLASLLTVFRKVCDALAFAHSQGIIHRDLKPENVMVGEFGEVLVMDWGLAKTLRQGDFETGRQGEDPVSWSDSPMVGLSSKTLQGSVMGTPQYMSPEQARGEIDELDARSDIFSLGGILYAILTLRAPVEGTTLEEVLSKVRTGSIASPSAYGATAGEGKTQAKGTVLEARKITPLPHIAGGKVPAALSAVVMKALTLDKTKRYQSVAEFSTDVEAYQGGFATIAEQAGLAKQLALLIKRHKGIFITATAAWLLISGLAVWFVLNLRTKEQRATQAEALAVLREGETSKALGRSAISLAEAALREGNGFAMQAALKEVPENLRDSTWHYLLGQSDTSIARIDWGTQIDSAVAHPHLPSVFAVVDHGGKVTLLNVRTGERFLEFDSGFPQEGWCVWYRIAMSSDGERIAVGRRASAESNLRIFGARDGKQVLSCDGGGFTWQLEFSPDGKMLLEHQYRENSSNRLNFWSVSTGKVIRSHDIGGGGTVSVFTPDGQAVLVQSRKQPPRLVGVWNDSLSRRFECPAAQTAALRPDGRLIVTGDMSGMVRGVDVADGSVVFETRSAANLIDHIIFHPDGTRFATISTISEGRQVIQLWDSQTGGPLQALLGGSGAAMGAAAHPLSGELLVCGPDSRVWDLSFARWTLHSDRSARIAFFGDDNVVFAPAKLADACLQQLQDRDVVNLMESSAASAFANVSVSADGRVVAGETKWTSSGVEFIVQRRDAGGIKQVGAFKPLYGAEVLRLNPKGERAAIVHGQSAGFAVYLTANGQTLNGWESRDFRRFNDIEWLSNEHLLGLVTARADRGSPGSEELVVIWDMATGKILRSAAQLEVMDVLAVSPDGLRFAEAGADKKVRIRDAATLAVLKEFRAHDGPITALAWHPKKPILASGSADLTLRLWNLETGARIDELRGPLAVPHTLAFAPSGQRLGCASLDATTRIWDPPSLRDKTSTPQKVGSDARDERVWFKKPPPKKPKAAPPKDIEGWEDLLASFSREEVERTGRGWSLKDGELFSPAKVGHVALALPGNLMGTSYRVRLLLRQLPANDCLHITLPVANSMCGFVLEGNFYPGTCTGLIRVNGKWGKELPGTLEGKVVKDTRPHDLEITVRLDGANATITTTLDGEPLYEWTGPIASLSMDKDWATTAPGSLALGTYAGGWAVSGVKVKRLQK